MIIRAYKLNADGIKTGESIDLEVLGVDISPDTFAMDVSPVRIVKLEDLFPSTVTFLVEEDFMLIQKAMDDETPHSD